jgi:uncharacterized membrane-anchored protein YitT (DUF2179 family)
MKELIKKIVQSQLWRLLDPFAFQMKDHPKRILAKRYRRFKLTIRKMLIDLMFITIGVLAAGFGLKGFLLPNQFIDGGAVGISLLIAEVTPFSLSTILLIVSIPFIVLGWRSIGWEFAVKTGMGIVALAAAVAFIPYPEITQDKLLISVFGGFFLGMGIGMAVRGGGVIDGTEVLAINVSRKTGISIGDIILIFNILIFSVAAYVLSVEVALYSILTYLVASKTVDFIIEGIEEYTGVTIISPHADEIHDMIKTVLGRGVTVYKGVRGHGKTGSKEGEMQIIYTVITRLEVSKLNFEIEKIDPSAFVVMTRVKDTKGGMIKHRPLH